MVQEDILDFGVLEKMRSSKKSFASPQHETTKITCNSQMKFFPRVRDTAFELVPCMVEKLTMYRSGPSCGGDLGGHLLDEGVGNGAAELTCGELVDDGAFRSGQVVKC